jgi:SOS-response transcriptional repressor LexA
MTIEANDFPTRTGRLAGIGVRVKAPETACDEGGVFALQVLGDSMLPEFEPGDIVVVEPDGRIDDGSFVVARCGDEWLLRQIRRAGTGWRLVALAVPDAGEHLSDLTAVRGVVVQKSKPGRRRTIKRYD